jgi:tripartite ATP-independent transporter DctM subunit
MIVEPLVEKPADAERVTGWRAVLRGVENGVVVAALACCILLPLVEMVLRKFFNTGIPAQSNFLQHLTLIIGMAGGAVAAREGRLLALSVFTATLPPRWRAVAQVWSGSVSAVIAGFLCVASVELVQSEREAQTSIIDGVPTWWLQLVLPVGFGLIAWRLAWQASTTWWGRLACAVLIGLLLWMALRPPVEEAAMVPWLLGLLLTATILGAPVVATLGGAAIILFWGEMQPIASVPLTHYSLVTNATLPTIPLFTVAGYFLAEGASQRLVRVFHEWFGGLRGGPAIVTALACAFFTSFTGGSGVTILALGGLLLPVLLSSGYRERPALGLITSAGSLGMLFPPCLPVILYSIVASQNAGAEGSVTMEQMFLGGLGPGLLLVGITAAWGMYIQPRVPESQRHRFNARQAWRSLRAAVWELLLPVVALVALFGGFATPVEAAAVTALYAFMVEVVFHRNLRALKEAPRVMLECGMLVGGVLLIFGVALGFTNYLVDAEIPSQLVAWAMASVESKWMFLLCLNLILLLVGGLIEIYAAIVVVVPLLVPLGEAFGIHPVHLGIIFLANMELGFLAPPIGMNLLLSSYRFKKPLTEVMLAVLPMLFVLLLGVLLITYFPPLTMWLPEFFFPTHGK